MYRLDIIRTQKQTLQTFYGPSLIPVMIAASAVISASDLKPGEKVKGIKEACHYMEQLEKSGEILTRIFCSGEQLRGASVRQHYLSSEAEATKPSIFSLVVKDHEQNCVVFHAQGDNLTSLFSLLAQAHNERAIVPVEDGNIFKVLGVLESSGKISIGVLFNHKMIPPQEIVNILTLENEVGGNA